MMIITISIVLFDRSRTINKIQKKTIKSSKVTVIVLLVGLLRHVCGFSPQIDMWKEIFFKNNYPLE